MRISAATSGTKLIYRPGQPGNFIAAHSACTDSAGTLYVGEIGRGASNWLKDLPAHAHNVQRFVRVR